MVSAIFIINRSEGDAEADSVNQRGQAEGDHECFGGGAQHQYSGLGATEPEQYALCLVSVGGGQGREHPYFVTDSQSGESESRLESTAKGHPIATAGNHDVGAIRAFLESHGWQAPSPGFRNGRTSGLVTEERAGRTAEAESFARDILAYADQSTLTGAHRRQPD